MSTPKDGFLYFAKCLAPDGYDLNVVKIGCAEKPEKRIKSVATNQPFTCELVATAPGGMFLEHFTHMWLRNHKLTGEFFHNRGEVAELMEYVRKHGRHPFPISFRGPEGWFKTLDLVHFMDKFGISMRDVSKTAGVTFSSYDALLKREQCGNRRLLAAVSVTAVRRGFHITYPADFRPSSEKLAA